jgi:hypothetical protein
MYFPSFLTNSSRLRKRIELYLPNWSTQGLQVASFSVLNVLSVLSLFLSNTSVAISKERSTLSEVKFVHLVKVLSVVY